MGEADRHRQLNVTTAMTKARTRSSEVTRKDQSLREGLAESKRRGWPKGVSMKPPDGRLWKWWRPQSIPWGRSPEHLLWEGEVMLVGSYNVIGQEHAHGGQGNGGGHSRHQRELHFSW